MSEEQVSAGPSAKISRKVFSLLDEHFDEGARLYHPGWSDDEIAKEACCAPGVVERLRREAFGPLAEDPKLKALRDDFDLLQIEVFDATEKLGAKIADLGRRVDFLLSTRKV